MKNLFKTKKKNNFKITIEIDGDSVSFESKDLFDDKTDDVTLEVDRQADHMIPNFPMQLFEIRVKHLIDQFIDKPGEFKKEASEISIAMAREAGVPEEIIQTIMKGVNDRDDDTKTTLH